MFIVVLQVIVEKIVYKDVIKNVDKVVERKVEVPVEVERRVEVPVPYEKIVIVPSYIPNFPTFCASLNFGPRGHSEGDGTLAAHTLPFFFASTTCAIIVLYTAT